MTGSSPTMRRRLSSWSLDTGGGDATRCILTFLALPAQFLDTQQAFWRPWPKLSLWAECKRLGLERLVLMHDVYVTSVKFKHKTYFVSLSKWRVMLCLKWDANSGPLRKRYTCVCECDSPLNLDLHPFWLFLILESTSTVEAVWDVRGRDKNSLFDKLVDDYGDF